MHNSIYEVSHSPIPASQRARAGNMPDWFFERVCDYAENPTPRQREEALGVLFKTLGRFCTKEGAKFSLIFGDRENFSPSLDASAPRKAKNCPCPQRSGRSSSRPVMSVSGPPLKL